MTSSELNSQLTLALKNYIRFKGHNETGALYNSIKFKSKNQPIGGLEITLTANEYIQYLDKGDFVDNFFGLDSTLNIIGDFIADDLSFTLVIKLV
jgi:hypothetical protein